MKMQQNLYPVFDAVAEKHWWFTGRRKIVLSFAENISGRFPRGRIADIGCGAGATLKKMEQWGLTVGADTSIEALRYSRRRGCRRLCLVEEEELPFGNEEFDLVVSMDVIEHLERDYFHLREYLRILRKGGYLLLTVPALARLWTNHDQANRHRRRYSRAALKDLLQREGWRIERLSYFSSFLFLPIAAVKLSSKIITATVGNYNPAWNFKIPGRVINNILSRIFSREASWLLKRDFPIGSSLLAVCRKQP